MKILHIITRLDKGGSSDIAMLCAQEMLRRGHDVYLLSGSTKESDVKRALSFMPEDRTIFIEELARNINPVSDMASFFRIYLLINKLQPELIHTHSSKAGMLGRWAAWLFNLKSKITRKTTRVKVIHMPHGHILFGYFSPALSYLVRFIEKITTLITDKIITLTTLESEEYMLYKVAPKEKLITIHNGINLKIYDVNRKIDPPKDIFQYKGTTILCVSRLKPTKGQRYLLEAMPFVLHNSPDTRLLLVGDGTDRKQLERQAHLLNIENNVFFLGERTDIDSLLSISQLFVLPTLNEGLGIVLLEAQAMGVPVVASKVGGIPEVVKDYETGILVPPANSKELAFSILNILTKPELRGKLSKSAVKWVTEPINGKPHFGMERMFDKIEALYSEILKQ